MHLALGGKIALVTGGSRGIGAAIAVRLADEGCRVVALSRSGKAPREDILPLQVDVLLDDLDGVVSHVVSSMGGLDILVNNVGGGGRWGPSHHYYGDAPDEVWDDVYRKNAGAARVLTMEAAAVMSNRGWGRVVTIASMAGKEARPGDRPWFLMAKAAEIALMKGMAESHFDVRRDVTFNTVAPGYVRVNEDDVEMTQLADATPIGRPGTPREIANVVAFLCSPLASYVNGACVAVDGGASHSY